MFVRLLLLFVLIVSAAGLASWLMAQPGSLSIEWLGWQMEMRSSLAVTLVIVFALLLVFFDRRGAGSVFIRFVAQGSCNYLWAGAGTVYLSAQFVSDLS